MPHADGVGSRREGRSRAPELGVAGEVHLGDGRVGEHRVETADLEVAEVVHVVLVDPHVEVAARFEDAVRHRSGKHADGTPLERIERDVAGRVRADDQLLTEGEIRPAHRDLGEVLGRAFEAGDDDVERRAVPQRRDEHVPVLLHEGGSDAQLRGERAGEIDLEARQRLRPLRVVIDVGRAALGVVAPAEDAPLTDLRPGDGVCRRREEDRRDEMEQASKERRATPGDRRGQGRTGRSHERAISGLGGGITRGKSPVGDARHATPTGLKGNPGLAAPVPGVGTFTGRRGGLR